MIHRLVLLLFLSHSTPSTTCRVMEDLQILAANALVKNVGRTYASLSDIITPSIIEQVSVRVLETTASSLQAAVARIMAQQKSFQEVTETRLANLKSSIMDFSKSIPVVQESAGVQLDLPSSRLNTSPNSTADESIHSFSTATLYDIPEQFRAARRTLGFFPVVLNQPAQTSNTSEDLNEYLMTFLRDYLGMDSFKVRQLVMEEMWYNSTKSML